MDHAYTLTGAKPKVIAGGTCGREPVVEDRIASAIVKRAVSRNIDELHELDVTEVDLSGDHERVGKKFAQLEGRAEVRSVLAGQIMHVAHVVSSERRAARHGTRVERYTRKAREVGSIR